MKMKNLIFFWVVVILNGCAAMPAGDTHQAIPATFSSPESEQVFKVLVGELSGRYGNYAQSSDFYLDVALRNPDPKIAARATEMAAQAGNMDSAWKAVNRWLALDPEALEAHQYLAILRLRRDEYDEAARELVYIQQAIDKEEGKSEGYNFVISLLSLEQDQKRVYEVYKRFAERDKQDVRTQLGLARLALGGRRFEESLNSAERAYQLATTDKDRVQAALTRTKALVNLKRFDEALKSLRTVVGKTDDERVRLEYARLLVLSGREDEAIVEFEKLYQEKPESIEIYYTLALLYIDKEAYTKAEALMHKVLSEHPRRADAAHYFLGQINERRKNYEAALQFYNNVEPGEFWLDAQTSSARLLNRHHTLEAALAFLSSAAKKAPSAEEKVYLLLIEADLLYQKKEYEAALSVYNQILADDPENVDVLYGRSLAYDASGQAQLAENDLRQVLRLEPENITALNALGYTLADRTTRYEEAYTLISQALALRPNDPAIIDSMGWVEYRLGNLQKAENYLRKAFDTLADPEIASHLIEVLWQRGKYQEARKILSDMLNKHPKDEMLRSLQSRFDQQSSQISVLFSETAFAVTHNS